MIYIIYYTLLIVISYKNETLFVDNYSQEKAFGFKPVEIEEYDFGIIHKSVKDNDFVDTPEIIDDEVHINNEENIKTEFENMKERIENSIKEVPIDPIYQETLDTEMLLSIMNQPINKRRKKHNTILPISKQDGLYPLP